MNQEETREYAKTMTFRDAVYNLTQAKCIPYYKATLIKVHELLDLIEPKKALEQESCKDCISRNTAIVQLSYNKNGDDDCDVIIQKDIETIKSLPPVTPKPKIGQWILSGGYWRCSKCKEKALLKLDKSKGNCREYMPVKSNFCPNCGKNMLGIQTSSERNNKK